MTCGSFCSSPILSTTIPCKSAILLRPQIVVWSWEALKPSNLNSTSTAPMAASMPRQLLSQLLDIPHIARAPIDKLATRILPYYRIQSHRPPPTVATVNSPPAIDETVGPALRNSNFAIFPPCARTTGTMSTHSWQRRHEILKEISRPERNLQPRKALAPLGKPLNFTSVPSLPTLPPRSSSPLAYISLQQTLSRHPEVLVPAILPALPVDPFPADHRLMASPPRPRRPHYLERRRKLHRRKCHRQLLSVSKSSRYGGPYPGSPKHQPDIVYGAAWRTAKPPSIPPPATVPALPGPPLLIAPLTQP